MAQAMRQTRNTVKTLGPRQHLVEYEQEFPKALICESLSQPYEGAEHGCRAFDEFPGAGCGRVGAGETDRAAAKRFGVSASSAARIGQRQPSGRARIPLKIDGHRQPALSGDTGDRLRACLAKKRDPTTLAPTAGSATCGVHATHDTAWRIVRAARQPTPKKLMPAVQTRPQVARFRTVGGCISAGLILNG